MLFALAIWVARHPSVAPAREAFNDLSDQIVWLDVAGPGGGGGGGGNENPEPVQKVELKGEDKTKITVPVAKPPDLEQPKPEKPPDPVQNLTIPAQTLASADLAQAGAMEGIPSSESLGLGRQGGAGTGVGTGIGPGQGSGLGPGTGGGTGGGAEPARQRRRDTAAAQGSEAEIHCARDARENPGRRYCSSAWSSPTAPSATSASCDRSTRPSVSTRKPSSPRVSGASLRHEKAGRSRRRYDSDRVHSQVGS